MIDQGTLKTCRNAIQHNLGSLADLPPELANTITNVYYRFHAHARRVALDNVENLESFVEDTATILSSYEAAKAYIDALRHIDKIRKPNLYAYTVTFILDALKYEIDRPHEKSGLRRLIERQFRRHKVKEIPDLCRQL